MSIATPIPNPELNRPSYVPEKYSLGQITKISEIDFHSLSIDQDHAPKAVYEVEIEDPYVLAYSPEVRLEVKAAEREASEFASKRRQEGLWERRSGTAYFDKNNNRQTKHGWGDPVSRDAFFNEYLQSPTINAWRTKIPSAQALADLSDPLGRNWVLDRKGRPTPIDENGRKWLALCTDAVAIRSRGTIMADVVREFIHDQRSKNPDQSLSNLKWMSVACGTALPAMKAAMHAQVSPEMMLVDLDINALEATQILADEIGYEGRMSQRSDINIFLPEEMNKLRTELGDNGDRPMLLDLMGIFEYTGDNLGVDPVQFLKSNYDMLHPGGRLVFGQMRDDRPVADFTMGVVSWPYVEMRSPAEFLRIIDQAGIPTQATQLYLPSDGVYTVGVIDKPLNSLR